MEPKGITKQEWKILNKWGYADYKENITTPTEIREVIVIVHDPSRLHDSGYPFIRVFGVIGEHKDKKLTLFDMGWHDHILISNPDYESGTANTVNIDALHKNIFRYMNWKHPEKKWILKPKTCWCSTLELTKAGEWQ